MRASALKGEPQCSFRPEASDDVAEAYAWYEARDPGLGEEFLRAVAACLGLVQRHPQLYPVAVDEFRRALLRRFPYEMFYECAGEDLIVYAVFHCAQDPRKWRKRLSAPGTPQS